MPKYKVLIRNNANEVEFSETAERESAAAVRAAFAEKSQQV